VLLEGGEVDSHIEGGDGSLGGVGDEEVEALLLADKTDSNPIVPFERTERKFPSGYVGIQIPPLTRPSSSTGHLPFITSTSTSTFSS